MGSAKYFDSGGRPLLELAIVLTFAAFFLVAARLTFRCIQHRDMVRRDRLGWDDYCIVAAMVSSLSSQLRYHFRAIPRLLRVDSADSV